MTIRIFNGGRPLSDPTFFTAHGFELVEQSVNARTSKEEYIELLKDVDGAMVGTLPLTDAEVLRSCPKLKVLSRSGVGVDSIDLDVATELGILACNTPGVNTTEVADHALGLLLALTRLIREFDGEVKLSLIHIRRCRRSTLCRSRWSRDAQVRGGDSGGFGAGCLLYTSPSPRDRG